MRYGSRDVLAGVDFTVRRGELVTLLGPNGAGNAATTEVAARLPVRARGAAECFEVPVEAIFSIAPFPRLGTGQRPARPARS